MQKQRKSLISKERLKESTGTATLPGSSSTKVEQDHIPRKDFSYELPIELGVRFQAWCKLQGNYCEVRVRTPSSRLYGR